MLRLIITIYFILTEVLYFTIGLVYLKDLKKKRIILFVLMLLAYLVFTSLCAYNIAFNILYTFALFLILKLLYKKLAHIIDIFLFTTLSISLVLISAITASIGVSLNSYLFLVSMKSLLMILSFLVGLKPLKKFYHKYVGSWNRNKDSKIKSITVRSLSLITFNVFYYCVYLGLIYALK